MNIESFAQVATIIIGIAALFIAWDTARATRRQAEQTEAALNQNEELSRANTIIHFTNAFLELVKENKGLPNAVNYSEAQWDNYWGLQGTEFYFFRRKVIPMEVYTLWMVDVVDLYASSEIAWKSHRKYLDKYSILAPKMDEFFTALEAISKIEGKTRHLETQKFVAKWINDEKNQADD